MDRLLAQLDRCSGHHHLPPGRKPYRNRPGRRQPVIGDVLAKTDNLDIAIVSIGAWGVKESAVWEKASPAIRKACEEAGSVAEFSGCSLVGQPPRSALPSMDVYSASACNNQKAAQQVIGFATGTDRADAVRAADVFIHFFFIGN
jgi:DNA-binding transcriptional regulator LsrR (DeoR family)